jgi:hypothetical protein
VIEGSHFDLGVVAARCAAAVGGGVELDQDTLARAASLLGHVDRTLPSALDLAWQAISALAAPGDTSAVGKAYNAAIGDALMLLEVMGGQDPRKLDGTAPREGPCADCHAEGVALICSGKCEGGARG